MPGCQRHALVPKFPDVLCHHLEDQAQVPSAWQQPLHDGDGHVNALRFDIIACGATKHKHWRIAPPESAWDRNRQMIGPGVEPLELAIAPADAHDPAPIRCQHRIHLVVLLYLCCASIVAIWMSFAAQVALLVVHL
jgi:hypothetical protein